MLKFTVTGKSDNDNGKFKKNGASTFSRINFSELIGHATIFSKVLNACMLFSSGVTVTVLTEHSKLKNSVN